MTEAVTWSFISKREAELFGGGKRGARARQSDRRRAVRHAAEPHSRSGHRRAEERRPRLCRRGAVRGRAGVQGRPAGGSAHRRQPACAARWPSPTAPAGTGRARPSPSMPSTPRPTPSRCWRPPARRWPALQVVPGGPAWFHPGRSGTIQIGPKNMLGHFGELHPRVLDALEADGPLVGFEVILEAIPEPKAKPTRAKPVLELSPFQPVERDFAFVVEAGVKAADIVRAAQSVDRKLIAGVSVFDVYEGKGIEAGQEVDRHRRHHAAAREDHDRRRDRRARPADRRRSEQAHRRRAAGLDLLLSSGGKQTQAGSKSANAKPSRSTVSPTRDRDLARQHRSGRNEGVEFAVLAARIDARRQGGEQVGVEAPAGEIGRQFLADRPRSDAPRCRRRSSRAPRPRSACSQSGNTGVMPLPASWRSR